jgi:hypothetical protein
MFRILILAAGILFTAAITTAQEEAIYIQVDYMKPLPNQTADYIWMEQNIYKPIHMERIRSGEIIAWQLYQVQYPRGADTEYDFVTVTVFANFNSMDEGVTEYETLVKKAHPDKTLEEVDQYATDTRELVRSEVFKSIDRLSDNSPGLAASLLVDYMKVPPIQQDLYVRLEQEIWRPMHKYRLQNGNIKTWSFFELLFPGGLNYPYSHATVTGFESWDKIKDSWPDDVWTEVHPNASRDELEDRAHETRDLVSSQIWKLLDYTVDEPEK